MKVDVVNRWGGPSPLLCNHACAVASIPVARLIELHSIVREKRGTKCLEFAKKLLNPRYEHYYSRPSGTIPSFLIRAVGVAAVPVWEACGPSHQPAGPD